MVTPHQEAVRLRAKGYELTANSCSYCTVTLIVVVCVIEPLVPVIVTLPLSGVGPLPVEPPPPPPPPHETAPNMSHNSNKTSSAFRTGRLLRSRRSGTPAKTIPNAKTKVAYSPKPRWRKGSGARRSRESTAPCRVTNAAPFPPVTVVGLIVQVVVPSDDGTLQVRATSELNPPTGPTARLSVMTPPLEIETTGLAIVSVKSGGMLVTVTGT